MIRRERVALAWQSKAVLLAVLPLIAPAVLLESNWWFAQVPVVAWTTLGISAVFGLVVWRVRAGTARAAATGAGITACLMYGTTEFPYQYSWLHGALLPLLAVFLLTFLATRVGRAKKQQLGVAEHREGRSATQVAANLGAAALVSLATSILSLPIFGRQSVEVSILQKSSAAIGSFAILAVLGEAAADTVSSEIGTVLGGQPRLITTFRRVEKGTDGGVTLLGTLAGCLAALIVVVVGFWAIHGAQSLRGGWVSILLATAGAIFGLLLDSLLGATLERRGLLNNDAVNFLSTISAIIFPLILIYILIWKFNLY